MDILLVEDETPKRDHIATFLRDGWPDAKIRIAKSVRSAVQQITKSTPDLMLLDMSLPTFDIGLNESGGRPQGFGGIEVLRYMDLYEINAPTIVVTAYEAFSKDGKDIDHAALHEQLSAEHPETYKGLIYYNSLFSEWRTDLSSTILGRLGYGKSRK